MSAPAEQIGHDRPLYPPPHPPHHTGSGGLVLGAAACVAVVALTVALLLTGAFTSRSATVVRPTSTAAAALNPAAIYAKANPGVVDITAQTASSASQLPFGLPGGSTASTDTGTGMVIDNHGDIVTADHVVAGAEKVTVTLPGGINRQATVVAGDASSDIAVLKINPSGLTLHPLALGSLASHRVGDPVAVIGDPFDVQRSLSTGVISGLDRTISGLNGYSIPHAMQTDAAMNPGNSGGPILDAGGRVIGIADQIATGNSGIDSSTGVGFAVPIEIVKAELPQLEAGKVPAHADLGIAASNATVHGVGGALVGQVMPGAAAARAGVKTGDIVTALGTTKVGSVDALIGATATFKPGAQTTVTVNRNGHSKTMKITLGKQPTAVTSR